MNVNERIDKTLVSVISTLMQYGGEKAKEKFVQEMVDSAREDTIGYSADFDFDGIEIYRDFVYSQYDKFALILLTKGSISAVPIIQETIIGSILWEKR